jgi:hypothetical protein
MSYKLDNVQVGDIIDITTTSVYAHKAGVVVAKFLVLAKEPSEANNNKNGDNDVLTLYMLYNFRWSPSSDKVGSIVTMAVKDLKGCLYSYKVAYRPEGKEVVQSGLSWDDHEPNENVGINTIMEDSL